MYNKFRKRWKKYIKMNSTWEEGEFQLDPNEEFLNKFVGVFLRQIFLFINFLSFNELLFRI